MSPSPRPGVVLAGVMLTSLFPWGPALAQPIIVELRGRDGTISGGLDRIGREGIMVRGDDAAKARPKWIAWDRVRSVRGDRGSEAAPFAELADSIWRARARLERGDLGLAEPDIDRLIGANAGLGGPTGTLLAELSVRVRIARGSQTGAVLALLRWNAVRRAADTTASQWVGGAATLSPAIDWQTGLATQCPPIFGGTISLSALEAFAASPDWDRLAAIEPTTRELALLYRYAAAGEIALRRNAEPPAPPESKSNDPGVTLVRDIVNARFGTPEQRRTARELLERRISSKAPANRPTGVDESAAFDAAAWDQRWIEAWCRAAVGRSLIREPEAGDQRRGVINLLHLPARFASDQPLLAPLAILDAAEALKALGDAGGSERVRAELRRLFPGLGPGGEMPISALPDPNPTLLAGTPETEGPQR